MKSIKLSQFVRLASIISSLALIFLISSAHLEFLPMYAAIGFCIISAIVSTVLLICDVAQMNGTDEWAFWETIFNCALSFLFLINTATMAYSSYRWGHFKWKLATVIIDLDLFNVTFFSKAFCCFVCFAFGLEAKTTISRQIKHLSNNRNGKSTEKNRE
ncbi:unnamed protein product [Caenorhabditis bovis]|uniref:MARVEL domain-containing protein n=1 Tax=Caenorhabditis bovis TaxID=2654633 RepID=A0A8S1F608_9PELO|nr:unnamed protein product [Caenorhabditis bovis]